MTRLPQRLSRRRLLWLLAGGAVAGWSGGCSALRDGGGERPVRPSALDQILGLSQPTPPVTLPDVTPFEPVHGDVLVAAKRVAGRFAQELLTNDPRRPPPRSGPAASAAGAVATPGPSVGEVVTAQLGGISPDGRQASAMVVARQHSLVGERLRTVTRTLDLRLRLTGRTWVVDSVASTGGEPVAPPPTPSAAARAVLENPAITLPDSARWDIHSGAIDEQLLVVMTEMAEVAPYAVTVLASGHPINVFGTSTVSNHTVGRGVDIAVVAGQPVVTQREQGSPAFRMAERMFSRGVPEVGSPWDFDAPASRRSFTNLVHADHLHIAFEASPQVLRPRAPASQAVRVPS